ncbi:hypothetical protein KC614_01485 [candidate division WWE3 bacterium]|uniref:Uncharacterized protein n=1 Tax=candidate division WWE3 bacterium TaxID=2053526 RepID=A0A955LK78_UNCKA|nr:hypothetical protein [candidate division WWE3 bacterium]
MRKLRFVLRAGVLVMLLFICGLLLTPPDTQAALPPNVEPSTIFTGRFIPAFIGGAYDPTEAYAAMAGLPVYVVAFDDWQGPPKIGGSDPDLTWIIGDRAVRTQIRADGTFQAQGLPQGEQYGVYFPFALKSSTGEIVRTDCRGGRDVFDGTLDGSDTDKNPCKTWDANRSWPFRMVRAEDRLADSFGYAALYNTGEESGTAAAGTDLFPIYTQVEAPLGQSPTEYEEVRVEHVFVTKRLDLDIDNNINTFPLVPTNTIKIQIESADESSSYEVWAMRYARMNDVLSDQHVFGPLDYPVIRGRAVETSRETDVSLPVFTFQAYAPQGNYAIIVWKRGNSSPTYLNWGGSQPINSSVDGSGVDSLNSSQYGVSLEWVRRESDVDTTALPGFSLNSDWRSVLDKDYKIKPRTNEFTVWGLVTAQQRVTSTSYYESLFTPQIMLDQSTAVLKINSADEETYRGYYNYNDLPDSNDFKDADFMTIDSSYHGAEYESVVAGVRGAYIVSNYNVGVDRKSVSNSVELSLATEFMAGSTATNQGLIRLYSQNAQAVNDWKVIDGPARLDFSSKKSTLEAAPGINSDVIIGGFGSGLQMHVTSNAYGGSYPAKGATVAIHPSAYAPDGVHITAESTTYDVDFNGNVFIPYDELKSIGDDVPLDEMGYTVKIQRTAESTEFDIGKDTSYQFQISSGSNADVLLAINDVQLGASGTRPDRYNLALLNRVDEMLSEDDTLAVGSAVMAEVPILMDPQLKGDGSAITLAVFVPGRGKKYFCRDTEGCELTNKDGSPIAGWTISGDDTVILRLAAPGVRLEPQCPGNNSLSTCDNIKVNSQTSRYIMTATAETDNGVYEDEHEISIDTGQTDVPNGVQLSLSINCKSLGDRVYKEISDETGTVLGFSLEAAMQSFTTKAACSVGKFFSQKVPSIFQVIYHYGLQTRALTQEYGVGQIYEIGKVVVNVIFIALFFIMAVMTILRVQPEQWHIRVLLPKLLLALILANYSILIVQAILDVNNFLSHTIFNFTADILSSQRLASGASVVAFGAQAGRGALAGGLGIVAGFGTAMVNMAIGLISLIAGTGGGAVLGIIFFVISFIGVVLIQLLLLVLIFFARYAVIWLATIAGPFVFALSVLPWFSNLREKWLGIVVGVAFVQTAVAGLLAVGVLLLVVGSGEDALFGGFGQALVGVIIFAMAFSVPKRMLSAAGDFIPQMGDLSNFRKKQESLALKRFKDKERQSVADTLQPPTGLRAAGQWLDQNTFGRLEGIPIVGGTAARAARGIASTPFRLGGGALKGAGNLLTGGIVDESQLRKYENEEKMDDVRKKMQAKAMFDAAKENDIQFSNLKDIGDYLDHNLPGQKITLPDGSDIVPSKYYLHLADLADASDTVLTVAAFTHEGGKANGKLLKPDKVRANLLKAVKTIRKNEKDEAEAKRKVNELVNAVTLAARRANRRGS